MSVYCLSGFLCVLRGRWQIRFIHYTCGLCMKKKDGFPGQQSYVIPERVLDGVRCSPLCGDLYLTDTGFYPQALHHYRERPQGVAQTILLYNVEGGGEIVLNDRHIPLPAHHFFIIPEGTPHAYAADKSRPWSLYWIHFSGRKAACLARPFLVPVSVERSSHSRVRDRLQLFNEVFYNLRQGFGTELVEYVNLLLPHLLASFTHLVQFRAVNEPLKDDPVSRSIHFMLEQLNEQIGLPELATAAGLSVSHYSRLFAARMGKGPIAYFIQLKMQEACRLLDQQNLSVAEIAGRLGFDDQFYFSRQFRKVMDMSPTAYRRR